MILSIHIAFFLEKHTFGIFLWKLKIRSKWQFWWYKLGLDDLKNCIVSNFVKFLPLNYWTLSKCYLDAIQIKLWCQFCPLLFTNSNRLAMSLATKSGLNINYDWHIYSFGKLRFSSFYLCSYLVNLWKLR